MWYMHIMILNDTITHPKITEQAVKQSILEDYLINNLGDQFLDGIETQVNNKAVIDWLLIGSKAEDTPQCRASNHFHNPLKPWGESAMSDQPLWLDVACIGWKPWYSNVTWATGYLSPPPDGAKAGFSSSPAYAPVNWDSARKRGQRVTY